MTFTASLSRILLAVALGPSPTTAGLEAAEPAATPPPALAVLTAAGTPFDDGDRIVCLGDSITAGGNGPTGFVGLLRAVVAGAPVGATVTDSCTPLELRPAVTVATTRPGLACAYYEGDFNGLPDCAKLTPVRTLTVAQPNLDFEHRVDQYALRFTGFLEVPADGLYRFTLTSDDGSRLSLDDQVVIGNDGFHDLVPVEGRAALCAGRHALAIVYFQGGGGHGLDLKWTGPGIAATTIPATAYVSAP